MKSPNKHPVGICHAFHALRNSLNGLREAWAHEDAFRQEVFIAVPAILFALYYPAGTLNKVLMVFSILLVLMIELINSAIEAAVDHTSLEQHPLARRAKDVAGAAVFLSLINVLVVWSLVLFA